MPKGNSGRNNSTLGLEYFRTNRRIIGSAVFWRDSVSHIVSRFLAGFKACFSTHVEQQVDDPAIVCKRPTCHVLV